ncbi:PfkB family carbohydrate kinase [uncultured Cohaesibacter sp.]|uniref:PfkB family carbohydrate kinase n=1 Tax=uncultured Cohaesibacter sp. TaxID=1002546 RepID=UPI0029C93F86|nr:PfkB family carbohydrate kinase [uncultured Cohaesibacter sp.]
MTISSHPAALLGIGDNVVDFYLDRNEFFPGGNALNVAVLAKRFGLADTGYIGIVGNDEEGNHVLNCLAEEQVWSERVRQAYGENGKAIVHLDDNGDRVFLRSNKGGIQKRLGLRLEETDLEAVERYGHVHSSLFSNLEHELPKIRERAKSVSFDFSWRHEMDYVKSIAPFITTAFFSGSALDDAGIDALIETVAGLGVSTIGVTRGSDGAFWMVHGKRYRQGIKPTTVIDTLGAGDSFIAGYISSVLMGNSVEEALDQAATFAASTCTIFGAFGHPYKVAG